MLEAGDHVEYVGEDQDDNFLYRGHPGLVCLVSEVPSVNVVGFVNGPSLDFSSTQELRTLDFGTYLHRGRRLVGCQHPLDDRPVQRHNMAGHEWTEGSEPTSG